MRNLSKAKIVSLALLGFLSLIYLGCSLESNYNPDSHGNPYSGPRGVTVTFNSNGGSSVAPCTDIPRNTTITLPFNPVRAGCIFDGWFTDDKTLIIPFTEQTIITKDITVYAKWIEGTYTNGTLQNVSLEEKLRIIADRADINTIYDIPISADTVCEFYDIITRGKNVVIKIHSASKSDIKKITVDKPSMLWTINKNITLVLEDIIIQGRDDNEYVMLRVSGGTLELGNGAKIVDNINTASTGGAVYIVDGGKMIIDGGEISGNEAFHSTTEATYGYGGGVFIYDDGYLLMKNGKIINNGAMWGGGVCIMNGMFIMNGGEISDNTAWAGGGVFLRLDALSDETVYFEKKPADGSLSSGVICDNTAYGDHFTNTYLTSQVAFWSSYRVGSYGPVKYRSRPLSQIDVISTKSAAGWEGEDYADEIIY
jgi:uncharacterized repeat protein (TIGR02543 family)